MTRQSPDSPVIRSESDEQGSSGTGVPENRDGPHSGLRFGGRVSPGRDVSTNEVQFYPLPPAGRIVARVPAEASRHTSEQIIAASIMDHVERICELSPRPMSWMNLDANVRPAIASAAVEALRDRGFIITEDA